MPKLGCGKAHFIMGLNVTQILQGADGKADNKPNKGVSGFPLGRAGRSEIETNMQQMEPEWAQLTSWL